MSTPVNLVKINVMSTGSGALMLGSAVPGYRGSEVLISGREYSYSIKQGANYEFGRCVYLTAPSAQMIRSPLGSSDGGTAIALSSGAQVALVLLAEDLAGLALPGALAVENNLSDLASASLARANLSVYSQAETVAYVTSQLIGLLDYKGGIDCSANPNYPAASQGDSYVITVAGKIGGASGKTVEAGDFIFAKADVAGGTDAAVGASWDILQFNLNGVLVASNNLSDLPSVPTARTNLGVNRRLAVLQIVGTPLGASEVLGTIAPPPNETWTIAGNFAGSTGKKKSDGVNPGATYAIAVRKNGAAAGTISISNAGAVTFATTGGATIVLDGSAGDYADFVGDAAADIAVGYVFNILATYA